MLGFMDYVQNAFYKASNWNLDNSYGFLTATSRSLLDFETPNGIRLNVSSLSSPNLATSYTLGSVGVVDGSVSYLYSSLPIKATSRSSQIRLQNVVEGYRHLQELKRPDEPWWWEVWKGGRRIDRRDALLYGRMYLPDSTLEALYLRRLSPTQQLKISCVSDSRLKNGGTILALLQRDVGKYTTEALYSTDSALVGVRGLYNFGPDPRSSDYPASTATDPKTERYGRLSAGGELYYGLANKSGGLSTGLRFTTLPQHTGFPMTMTATLNPLMGNLSASYAVKAGRHLSMATRFDFNVFSYESGVLLGCELWRRTIKQDGGFIERAATSADSSPVPDEDVQGVLKARIDQSGSVGLLWEGRVKDLLFTLGTSFDLRNQAQPFRALGVSLQYSS